MPTVRMTLEEARKFKLTRAEKRRLDAMTDAEITAAAKADPDNPPLTDAEFALMRKLRRGGRPPVAEAERKVQVTLRLPRRVLDWYRASGPGWQTRMGATLARAAPAGPIPAKRRKAK
jgi:uncharacterized protein (DUF4415 family)